MPYTVVSFHAHPDDEALLTAGTLAKAAAQGHRVVLVTATAGEAGLAASRFGTPQELAGHRLRELHASAEALGAARVVLLGYADSGLHGECEQSPGGPVPFAAAALDDAAERLAAVLREESADVLTIYDPVGGYGHPDHVQVYRVGRRAAELAGTPVVLQATVDRDLLLRWLRRARRWRLLPEQVEVAAFERAYAPGSVITHRIDVRAHAPAKRAAMAAHASQASTNDTAGTNGTAGTDRTLAALLRLPMPLYRRVLGREWFVQEGVDGRYDDIFATLEAP